MAFTKLGPDGAVAAKGKWALMMQTAISAKVRQQAAPPSRTRGGRVTTDQNRAALAKALAGVPAARPTLARAAPAVPATTTANKARLSALLADD